MMKHEKIRNIILILLCLCWVFTSGCLNQSGDTTPSPDSLSPNDTVTDSPAPSDSEFPTSTDTVFPPTGNNNPFPYPTAEMFGITGVSAVIFEELVDEFYHNLYNYTNVTTGTDYAVIPYIAIYDAIESGDLTTYICKVRYETFYNYEPPGKITAMCDANVVRFAVAEVVLRKNGGE